MDPLSIVARIVAFAIGVFAFGLLAMAVATYPFRVLTGPDSAQGFAVCVAGAIVLSLVAWWVWKASLK